MEAETTAWVNNIETAESITVPTPWVTAVDNLIVALKANGSWAKLDRLWLWNARFNDYARRLDIKNLELGTVNGGLTPVDAGYQGDGSTGYFDTQFVATTDAVNYTQNSASFGQWLETDLSVNQLYQGVRNVSQFARRNTDHTRYVIAINSTGAVTTPGIYSLGLAHINRPDSANHGLYVNGSLAYSAANTSQYIADNPFIAFAQYDQFGPIKHFDSHTASIMFFGADLSAEASGFYTALNDYRTAVAGISDEIAITVVKDGMPLQGAIVKFIQMDPFALDGADNTNVFLNATLLPGVFITNASGYAQYDGVFDSTKVQMAIWLEAEYDTEWKVEILGEIGSENINQTAPI